MEVDQFLAKKLIPIKLSFMINNRTKYYDKELLENIPFNMDLGSFLWIFRKNAKIKFDKRDQLNSNEGLFVFINNIIPLPSDNLKSLYDKYKNKDGYLYLILMKENIFG